LGDVEEVEMISDEVEISHIDFSSNISVSNLSFTYPGATRPAIVDADLEIKSGMSVAIVGSSGAGKTTLVDLLLGVIEPDFGSITISDLSPQSVVTQWPGAIAYVPQDVVISNGTVRENVALGFPARIATDELVWDAIDLAQLRSFVSDLPSGLDSQVGERGARISGGQRQRLGIARALFTKPKLLVLDEATSSLDGQTEADISDAIQGLKGSVTIVMIAHRLSTVRNADLVIYLHAGRILAQGSFEHVRNSVPNFDQQAQLMGL
jgi:ABC-type bacteriocin/lantibiotic exporter with double-glycine peptidase domain